MGFRSQAVLTLADGGAVTALRSQSQTLEKGLRAMTMKEKLAIHREIEAENLRKLREWLASQKKAS